METIKKEIAIPSVSEFIKEIDLALIEEKKQVRHPKNEGKVETNKAFGSLPAILRYMGAFTLIGAALTFMLQRWPEIDNHQMRYFSFLGFTLLLTLCGFFCGIRIKEDKGARTFLGLSAAIIPVHFAQLGALLFSLFADPNYHYPLYLTWKANSALEAVVTVLIGVTAVSAASCVAFNVLTRKVAYQVTAAYILLNSFLLLPFRGADAVAVMILSLGVITFITERYLAGKYTAMQTREGYFSRLMLATPLIFLVGRSVTLYSVSAVVISSILAVAAAFLFLFMPKVVDSKKLALFYEKASCVPSFLACLIFVADLLNGTYHGSNYFLISFSVLYAGILFLKSSYSLNGGIFFKKLAVIILLSCFSLQAISYETWYYSLMCIILSVITVSFAHVIKDKYIGLASLLTFASGLIHYLSYALDLYKYSPWLSLAVTGTLTVLLSSYVERNKEEILSRFEYLTGITKAKALDKLNG
jgi:hypothetical protein